MKTLSQSHFLHCQVIFESAQEAYPVLPKSYMRNKSSHTLLVCVCGHWSWQPKQILSGGGGVHPCSATIYQSISYHLFIFSHHLEFLYVPHLLLGASLVAQTVKHLPAMQETQVQSLGREDPLEKEMATHSSTLAWKIPWIEKPCRLQSMGSQRVGHDWATSLHFTSFTFGGVYTFCSNFSIFKISIKRHPSFLHIDEFRPLFLLLKTFFISFITNYFHWQWLFSEPNSDKLLWA